MELDVSAHSIKKAVTIPLYKDYSALKDIGYNSVAAYSGNVWTNYNDSDPGITILQILCYALTELGNKADNPVRNLLAREDGSIPTENQFYDPREAYPCNAVTSADVCKLLLDAFSELKQVYLQTLPDIFPGVTAVSVECKPDVSGTSGGSGEIETASLRKRIWHHLRRHSLVGCAFTSPVILHPQPIFLRGSIQIEKGVEVERLLGALLYKLNAYISPYPVYQSYNLPDNDNLTFADRLQGPLLKNGYIPDTCIAAKRQKVTLNEIGAVIVSTTSVTDVALTSFVRNEDADPKSVDFNFDTVGVFNIESLNEIVIIQNSKPVQSFNRDKVLYYYQQFVPLAAATNWDQLLPRGEYRNVGEYYSIQHDFPATYGLTQKTHDQDSRLGEVKQLRAYLALFEQLMADYAASLANVSSFFSVESGAVSSDISAPTYSNQPLYGVPGFDEIVSGVTSYTSGFDRSIWQSFVRDAGNPYRAVLGKTGTTAIDTDRRLRLLEHLLARSAKRYDHQPLALTNPRYGIDTIAEIEYLRDTIRMLPELSSNRGRTYYKSGESKTLLSAVQISLDNELSISAFYQGIEEAVEQGLASEGVIVIAWQENDNLDYLYPANTSGKYKAVPGRNGYVLVWWNDVLLFSIASQKPPLGEMTISEARDFLDPLVNTLRQLREFGGFLFIDAIRLTQSLSVRWSLPDDHGSPYYTSEVLSFDLVARQLHLLKSNETLEIRKSQSSSMFEIGVMTDRGWSFLCADIQNETEAHAILTALQKLRDGTTSALDIFITDRSGKTTVRATELLNASFNFFPAWIDLFQQPIYQELLERKLRECVPLYVDNSLWLLSQEEMSNIVSAYSTWMNALSEMFDGHGMNRGGQRAVEALFDFIKQLQDENTNR